ncbi:MAG: hypothetical protein KIT14_21430 [bacterium]|nr:hypothetical protein [bacterium]
MRHLVVAVIAVTAALAVAGETTRKEDAGLRYSLPTTWQRVPAPSDMRAAQYRIPRAGTDTEDGELVLFFFGKSQGGGVEQNLERWFSQFTQPDGRPTKEVAVIAKRKVGGLEITDVDLSGTYKPGVMGGGGGAEKPHYRMLAAIVEGEGGPWFFRATGPDTTIRDAQSDFGDLLGSLEPHPR